MGKMWTAARQPNVANCGGGRLLLFLRIHPTQTLSGAYKVGTGGVYAAADRRPLCWCHWVTGFCYGWPMASQHGRRNATNERPFLVAAGHSFACGGASRGNQLPLTAGLARFAREWHFF